MQSDLTPNLFAMSVDKNYCKFSRCVNTDIVAFCDTRKRQKYCLESACQSKICSHEQAVWPFFTKIAANFAVFLSKIFFGTREEKYYW